MIKLPATDHLRLYSDIHLDFDINPKRFDAKKLWMPERLETDKNTTLILTGDLWHAKKTYSFSGYSWLKEVASQFQYVIIVLGNHDFWNGNISKEYGKFKQALVDQNITNTFLLQNEALLIGDNKFIGATLWTDFNKGRREAMNHIKNVMYDYKYIKIGKGFNKLKPENILDEHLKSKQFIFENAIRDYPEQKIYVLTHHAPSIQSVKEEDIRPDTLLENYAYYSDLEKEIINSQIDYWFHGHLHNASNYTIGTTNVINNARGYPDNNSQYNPWHLMPIENNTVITDSFSLPTKLKM
jgi:predicted MPP superfamily phosphohydrolase